MKKKVSNFINASGARTSYSGKTKTMFIKTSLEDGSIIEEKVLAKFGFGMPFRIEISPFVKVNKPLKGFKPQIL